VRLEGKVAMVVGAGQAPGRMTGNGKATSMVFAREGAKVLCVDRDKAAAEETVAAIRAEGGMAEAAVADVRDEDAIKAVVAECVSLWGRIDVLDNNVGVAIAFNDAPVTEITVEAFDTITAINLRGMVLSCKHVIPVMRQQETGGSIINISSSAAYNSYPYVTYKTSKAAVIALTNHVAIWNAKYGIRANTIVPGSLNTPTAVENRVKKYGLSFDEVVAQRDKDVPLRGKMGTAWDLANAALFFASDESSFITGAQLPLDGGLSIQIGRPPMAAEAAENAGPTGSAGPVAGQA
jgi:NAD(P)-dependent dehydrogenase (short-subunit alcohol dehydrogenase family)